MGIKSRFSIFYRKNYNENRWMNYIFGIYTNESYNVDFYEDL